MTALLRHADVTLWHSLVTLLLLVASSSSSDPSEGNRTAVESRGTTTPIWWPFVECFFLADVNKCLQDQTVRAFVGLDRKDDVYIDTEKETVKLPGENEEGIFEVLGDLVSDGLSKFFQDDKKGEEEDDDDDDDDDEEEEEDEEDDDDDEEEDTDEIQPAENGDSNKLSHENNRTLAVAGNIQRSMETGRGKKKKKKKMIKKAIIKLIILIVLLKIKFLKSLYVFGKFLQFKLVLLITINTIINVIRFIMEWKKKKEPENVVYSYEQAHHQHHYDEHHHVDPIHQDEDKGWLGGLWSRAGTHDGGRSISPAEYAHDIAYSAQKPSQNYAYSAQKASQVPARYAQASTQGPARYAQESTQDPARYAQKSVQIEANYENKPSQQVAYYSYVQNPNFNAQRSL
ncbi:hypothetical protein B7P43_G09570 [Cryptotermes secundus]|uniref:Uncharacterized protein n=1 Tax=Cryptotermes secundus TaxID=105785 RepID=A0A2J7RQ99_9NEOP|nr:uncharacterized protein LOC111865014 [Cryptotermes secundus]PNF43008.1 hypothetical protein B7P43_G09570 [Cryptotermes secundus]